MQTKEIKQTDHDESRKMKGKVLKFLHCLKYNVFILIRQTEKIEETCEKS